MPDPSSYTKIRTVRVPDELWERVQAKAKIEGVPIAQVIRRALFAYVR